MITLGQEMPQPTQTKDSLTESRRYLQALFENSLDAILVTNDDGHYIDANPPACELLGYSHDELTQLNVMDLTAEPFREEGWAMWRHFLTSGSQSGEYSTRRKDGRILQLEYRAVANILPGVHVSWSRDITERKQAAQGQFLAERAMRDSEERYRKLTENFPNGTVITYDTDLRVTFIAGQGLHEAGFSPDFFIGKLLGEIAPPEVVAIAEPHFRAAFGGLTETYECPYPDGRVYFCAVAPLLNGDGLVTEIQVITQNITKCKQAEDALCAAERQYRDIFENASEGIFQSTPDGKYINANSTLAHMYGFASAEDLIHSCHDISAQIYVEPARREDFKRQLEEQGAIQGFEHEAFRKDRSTFWISVNARAVRDEQGTIQYYEGTGQDVTERKRAEETLRESEERYRELFENAKDAIYVHDLNGRYLSVNRAAEKLAGRPREDIIGKSFFRFLPREHVAAVNEHLCKKLIEKGETAYETEIIRGDGQRVAVEVNSHLILENGIPVGVQGTARDITERKRAEQKLGEYEKAVEGLDEMIVVIDRDYRYLLANSAYLKYRGLGREQIVGQLVSEILNPGVFDNVAKERLDRCFAGNIVKYETTDHFPMLGERNLFISYFPIENSNGIVRVACVLKDITESKQAEERLKTNSEQLRALSARLHSAREEEGARIAREIHDELGAVLTSLKWDLESADKILAAPVEPHQTAALREKLQTLMKLSDMGITTLRRIASELRPSVLDDLGLPAAIEWQAQQFQARTGIVCYCDCSLESTGLSHEQSTAAFRILQEALTNVLRHAQATRVDIKIAKDNGNFILSIRDNGKGITEAEKTEPRSLGILGMRERAHLIAGEIDIQGVNGEGTAVIVRVPIHAEDQVRKMTG